MSSITSGRVLFRYSLQPSSAAPPKSAAVRWRAWSMVPMAPSSTRIRVARASARACRRSSGEFTVNLYFTEVPQGQRFGWRVRVFGDDACRPVRDLRAQGGDPERSRKCLYSVPVGTDAAGRVFEVSAATGTEVRGL